MVTVCRLVLNYERYCGAGFTLGWMTTQKYRQAIPLMKRKITDWGKVLLLLLDEAAVLVLVILVLKFLGVRLALPITIGIVLLLGGFVFVTQKLVIASFHRKQVTGREGMIGLQGRVVERLALVGAIIVEGEIWRAKSVDDNIGVDEIVEIIGLDGLTLKVRAKSDS